MKLFTAQVWTPGQRYARLQTRGADDPSADDPSRRAIDARTHETVPRDDTEVLSLFWFWRLAIKVALVIADDSDQASD